MARTASELHQRTSAPASDRPRLRSVAIAAMAAVAGFACAFAIARGGRTDTATHDAATVRAGPAPRVSGGRPPARSSPPLRAGGTASATPGEAQTTGTGTAPAQAF